MAYTRQNFEDGQVLKAEHLNKMEDGIVAASLPVVELTTAVTAEGATFTEAENAALTEAAATGTPIIIKCTVPDNLVVCGTAVRTTMSFDDSSIAGFILYFMIGSVQIFGEAGVWSASYTNYD